MRRHRGKPPPPLRLLPRTLPALCLAVALPALCLAVALLVSAVGCASPWIGQSRAALEARLGQPAAALPLADGGEMLRYRQTRQVQRLRGLPRHPVWTVYENVCQQDYLLNRQGVVTQVHFQCAL